MQYDTAQEAYTSRYTHETVVLGFSITEEAMEDNMYASLSAATPGPGPHHSPHQAGQGRRDAEQRLQHSVPRW